MPPLMDNMDKLSTKHQNINKLVKETLEKKTPFDEIVNQSGNADVDNLYKIKVASELRNVQYIIEVLKSQDMLYVSHAIKHSVWLITDIQYSNIINPQFLYNELFPLINGKVIHKLLLQIRLHLKDESRVEAFFKHYEENDELETAIKWLPNCSVPFIEKTVEKHAYKISVQLFKRLCKRSFTILEVFLKNYKNYRREYLNAVKFLIKTHCRDFVKALNLVENYERPAFDQKHTTILLQEYPEILQNELVKFVNNLHIETIAKYLGPDKIKDFLLKLSKDTDLRSNWFLFENIEPFIAQLHVKERFRFVKALFIDKSCEDGKGDAVLFKEYMPISSAYHSTVYGSPRVYRWYKFTSFSTAFPELKKMVKSESSFEERVAILKVLIFCARSESDNVHKLLQYFHEKHINEPFKFKIEFINSLLSMIEIHKLKEDTWKILDEIFYNLEVYFESENNVENCINAIIVYKILHNQPVPQVLEKKINLMSFDLKLKMEEHEKDLVFKYLHNLIENKIGAEVLGEESSLSTSVDLMLKLLNLLKQMHKDLALYPNLLEKIKQFVDIKQNKGWKTNLEPLFNVNNSWRRLMFENSLVLGRKVDACLNALKHDPTLLSRRSTEVQELRRNEKVILDRFISKLRVYWPETLAADWTAAYRSELKQPPPNKSIVRGLCVILPPPDLHSLLREYAPTDAKIQWSEVDEVLLGVQKYLGLTMYLARPQPPPEILLQYAVGDYLSFTLPSLNSVFNNLNENDSREVLPRILNASTSVSLQKHGIRLAFSKLNSVELKEIFLKTWTTSKNMTIRAVVFELTYKLLCKEKNEQRIKDIWQLLEMFIEKLSAEEDRKIYTLMEKVDQVPSAVRAQFCMKSYKMLKSLPPKANCETLIKNIIHSTRLLMDTIDPNFVADIILEFLNKYYVDKKFEEHDYNRIMLDVISAFILHCKDEEIQMKRYEQIILPIIKHSKTTWDEKYTSDYVVRDYFKELIHKLIDNSGFIRMDYVVPKKMFKKLKEAFETQFSLIENYYILTYIRINISFLIAYDEEPLIKVLKKEKESSDSYDLDKLNTQIWETIISKFLNMCIQLLKEDMTSYFPSIQIFFGKILRIFMDNVTADYKIKFRLAKELLLFNDEVSTYLLALKLLPTYAYDEQKQVFSECCKKILEHPSPEVKMHYYRKFKNTDNIE